MPDSGSNPDGTATFLWSRGLVVRRADQAQLCGMEPDRQTRINSLIMNKTGPGHVLVARPSFLPMNKKLKQFAQWALQNALYIFLLVEGLFYHHPACRNLFWFWFWVEAVIMFFCGMSDDDSEVSKSLAEIMYGRSKAHKLLASWLNALIIAALASMGFFVAAAVAFICGVLEYRYQFPEPDKKKDKPAE